MERTRFTAEQVIGLLKEAEAGRNTADLTRQHGVSEAAIYNRKAKYGGLEVSETNRHRHRDALFAGVATKDVAGEQSETRPCRSLSIARNRHFRRDQGRIVAHLEFALGRFDGKRRFFGGHDGRSQQI